MKIKYFNRTVGELRADRVFICYKDESHIYRKLDSIGLQRRIKAYMEML